MSEKNISFFSTREPRSEALLFKEELEYIKNASRKRCIDFTAGRWCAHNAVANLGQPMQPVRKGNLGQPLWPQGIAGSISHTTDFYCAAATKHYKYIGIDVESIGEQLDDNAIELVFTTLELDGLAKIEREKQQLNKYLMFSAKESFYKCVFPLVNRVFDFKDVEININWKNRFFEINVLAELSELIQKGDHYYGSFWEIDSYILSMLTLKYESGPVNADSK